MDQDSGCSLCPPHVNAGQELAGYQHHLVLATVVGTGLSLPFDVEPYGPGGSEYAAGQGLMPRAVKLLGVRSASYLGCLWRTPQRSFSPGCKLGRKALSFRDSQTYLPLR
jgi:hypothetical protein